MNLSTENPLAIAISAMACLQLDTPWGPRTDSHTMKQKKSERRRPKTSARRTVSRRNLLRYGLTGAGVAALGGGLYFGWPRERRNIIVVLIDTLRRDALGCYGNGLRPSPAIDALAAEGARFEDAVSTSGWTLPAIVSLLTGTWPTIHGAVGKEGTLTSIREEMLTAAEVFKLYGYNTFGWGNCAFMSPMLGLDRGFDLYDCRHAHNDKIRRADETLHSALAQLTAHKGGKNFLFVHLFDPHLDFDPPPGYERRFTGGRNDPPLPLDVHECLGLQRNAGNAPPVDEDIAYIKGAYYGEINFVDDQIARFVDELKQLGIYEDCTLVLLADHGEEFWEHGGFEHGHTLYDELIRIPLIIKAPAGTGPQGLVVRSQVRIIDVMPTLFEMAGLKAPEFFEGASLLAQLEGRTMPDLPAMSESILYGSEKFAWRVGGHKYIFDTDASAVPRAQLFDVRNDPGERHNLMESEPELGRTLRVQFESLFVQLQQRIRTMSSPRASNMGPDQIESLKSLGYIR